MLLIAGIAVFVIMSNLMLLPLLFISVVPLSSFLSLLLGCSGMVNLSRSVLGCSCLSLLSALADDILCSVTYPRSKRIDIHDLCISVYY